jgi:hypothetical protein
VFDESNSRPDHWQAKKTPRGFVGRGAEVRAVFADVFLETNFPKKFLAWCA